jgi:hypothetical protein
LREIRDVPEGRMRVWICLYFSIPYEDAKTFRSLWSLALDAVSDQTGLVSGLTGLVEIRDVYNRLSTRIGEALTYDMRMYSIYMWSPPCRETFLNSLLYVRAFLSGPVTVNGVLLDIRAWARVAVMYVHRMA